ncbi:AI-2E family transporter [Undibacterium sp.]|jgi:predicted PurR-regulated permease PerM|uniref:AI-2E family transporter n=1 Tax=Undibacterium sp. TaxID=1914977 RepID=UPI002D14E602|nr:AI-2E family transporter [Undibacterium sp.]HTD02190.1 AI-2E family transporter [Undibacterium sp.]
MHTAPHRPQPSDTEMDVTPTVLSPLAPPLSGALGSTAPAGAEANQSPAVPRIHVDARGWAITMLAAIAFVFALNFAQKFFIPLTFAIFIAYTLSPLVAALQRLKIPRLIGTSLLMISIVCGIGMHVGSLKTEFDSILVQLPAATRKLSTEVTRMQYGQASLMQKMQAAATELEKATSQATGAKPDLKKPVVSDQPVFKLREWLLLGSMGVMDFLGQAVMVLFLVFFLLLSDDTFKRKLVKLTGPSLTKKKITVQILSDINTSIQHYMFMLLVTNALLGLLIWAAFQTIGLENAGAWALTSALLHIIPYFGSLLIAAAAGVVAFMQFGSISMALLVAGVSLGIATVVGTFVTTWMTGRIAKMNAAAVFISLLFWGWLWGIWGLLLGIPIIVIVKVVSEHIEGLEAVSELLGE